MVIGDTAGSPTSYRKNNNTDEDDRKEGPSRGYGDYDDDRYHELFPESPEVFAKLQQEEEENRQFSNEYKQKQVLLRTQRRRNHHPHMSDSDEDDSNKIVYVKRKKNDES